VTGGDVAAREPYQDAFVERGGARAFQACDSTSDLKVVARKAAWR
jgi:hypothetical protein